MPSRAPARAAQERAGDTKAARRSGAVGRQAWHGDAASREALVTPAAQDMSLLRRSRRPQITATRPTLTASEGALLR